MLDAKLTDAYQQVLEECRRRGEVLNGGSGDERRQHPRLRVRADRLEEPLLPWRLAVDISATGMAFYSDELCGPGQRVRIALGNRLAADAEVLACQEVPLLVLKDPVRYRVRCRFLDETEGMGLLLAIKEQERLHQAAD